MVSPSAEDVSLGPVFDGVLTGSSKPSLSSSLHCPVPTSEVLKVILKSHPSDLRTTWR